MWPRTSATLLTQLNSGSDPGAVETFSALYRPSVYRFARRFGLQHADAEDVAQQVIHSVSERLQNHPRSTDRGRFRSWLAQATRNAAINLVTRDLRQQGSGRTSVSEQLHETPASSVDLEQVWQEEERLVLYRAAATEVKANCTQTVWRAFEQTAVEGHSPQAVARKLDISVGVVYASRSRVLRRIRRVVERLHGHDDGIAKPGRSMSPSEGDV